MKTKTNKLKTKRMSKALIYFVIGGLLTAYCTLQTADCFSQAGVAINTGGVAPADCAIFDVSSSSQGVLIPRVALTATGTLAPIGATGVTPLLIYNTATTGNVIPGFYYWGPGSYWIPLGAAGATGATGGGTSGWLVYTTVGF